MPITRPRAVALCTALLLSGAGLVTGQSPASAATVVDTVDDELVVDGDCSLREAIEANNTALPYDACLPSAVIELPPGDYPVQFTLDIGTGTTLQGSGADQTRLVCTSVVTCIVNSSAGGPLVVDSLSMVDVQGEFIVGLMASGPLTVSNSVLDGSDDGAIDMANNTVRVVDSEVRGYVTAGIEIDAGRVEIERSLLEASANAGVASASAPVIVDHSTIRGHLGHAVVSETGAVEVLSSTIADNDDHGLVTASGDVLVRSSTLVGNGGNAVNTLSGDLAFEWATVVDNGGRALNYSGASTATVTGSIFANDSENCDNPVTSGGYNISDDEWCAGSFTDPTDQNETDPQLGPVGANGGLTATAVPLSGSPAIDVGGPCPGTDQRDLARPADGDADGDARCDAGAVEVAVAEVPPPGEDPDPEGPTPTTPTTPTTTPRPTGVDAPVVARPTFTG